MLIIGASGHAKVIADIAKLQNLDVYFCDDEVRQIEGEQVLLRSKVDFQNRNLVIGIGNNKIRSKIAFQYPENKFLKLFHPSSVINKFSTIGDGTVVMPVAVINVGVKIGKHCIVNTGAIIEHDCVLDDFVHVSPNATLCGSVMIGRYTWIGAGAIVIQGIKIGENVTIGAGSVVINNIPDNTIVVGNPAKIIKVKEVEKR